MFIDCVSYARHSSKSFIFSVLLNHVRTFRGGFPRGLVVNESTFQCRRCRRYWVEPWPGKSPRGGSGNPFQYSCLENTTDRGAWELHSMESQKNWTWLNDWAYKHTDVLEVDPFIMLILELGILRFGRFTGLSKVQNLKLGSVHPAHSRFNSRYVSFKKQPLVTCSYLNGKIIQIKWKKNFSSSIILCTYPMVRTTGTKCYVKKTGTEHHCQGRKFCCTCWWRLSLKFQGSASHSALRKMKVTESMLLFVLLKESLICFQYRPHFSFSRSWLGLDFGI